MQKALTHRRARRRLGTRSLRRSGTNGKVIAGTGSGKKRSMCRRHPKPARRICVAVRRLVEAAQ